MIVRKPTDSNRKFGRFIFLSTIPLNLHIQEWFLCFVLVIMTLSQDGNKHFTPELQENESINNVRSFLCIKLSK